jgi:hypothetical protein
MEDLTLRALADSVLKALRLELGCAAHRLPGNGLAIDPAK